MVWFVLLVLVVFPETRVEAAQQELPEAQHVLDDAEDGFDRGLALGVAGLALARAQSVRIGLGRRRLILASGPDISYVVLFRRS